VVAISCEADLLRWRGLAVRAGVRHVYLRSARQRLNIDGSIMRVRREGD
jgi:hypothetical protein